MNIECTEHRMCNCFERTLQFDVIATFLVKNVCILKHGTIWNKQKPLETSWNELEPPRKSWDQLDQSTAK